MVAWRDGSRTHTFPVPTVWVSVPYIVFVLSLPHFICSKSGKIRTWMKFNACTKSLSCFTFFLFYYNFSLVSSLLCSLSAVLNTVAGQSKVSNLFLAFSFIKYKLSRLTSQTLIRDIYFSLPFKQQHVIFRFFLTKDNTLSHTCYFYFIIRR